MYEFQHPTPVTVALKVRAGVIRLYAESRDDVLVTVEPMDGKDASRDAAEQTRVVLEGDTVIIEVPGADNAWMWRRSAKLAITVHAPAGSSVTGRSASADLTATGDWSAVTLDVASADVQIDSAAADVHIDSASGDIRLGLVGGSASLESSSGDMRVGDVTGDVSVKSASGDIRLGAVGRSLRVSTASGDVEVGRLTQGRSELKTASGDVSIGIAAGVNVWLDLNTASGRTISGLNPQPAPATTTDQPLLELRVRTASGDIEINRAILDRKAA
ncbi:DUF4097 family beta strand repeat-containing protein [Actinoplanes solisilvae]|uniref:DUF4097 family beta strand repeat-containing protein n=1 Tax=Actinoplanes solisilvae TaxID=2486853 RepID=UPI000FD81FF4|nr:DUF4097 family beta strand repeat-containing protein [Actinoplanes solisilvae]